MSRTIKPSILPGFMELLPSDQILFNQMMDTIRDVYEKHGFNPIDTPVIEKEEILLAKAGGETEKQLYRFEKGDNKLALRFDLTVPLARYVAQYYPELSFPFRRYQISKVFRGEKAQRGRFREFYQCDIDIIGNEELSVINDAEILSVIYNIFKTLKLSDFTIRINNRKILYGLMAELQVKDSAAVLRSMDKIEKIGQENVIKELKKEDISDANISKIVDFVQQKGSPEEIISYLRGMGIDNEVFQKGIEELAEVVEYIKYFQVPQENYTIDLTIVRGLDYYTGTIYETMLNDYQSIGSVCSGGRYENLAGYYTDKKLPGVGVSIGLTRLFYQLRESNIIKNESSTLTKVLVIPMDRSTTGYSIGVTKGLREAGIVAETYLEDVKFKKKLNYANKLSIPYVIIIGTDEMTSGSLSLKNMLTGQQDQMTIDAIIKEVQKP